jgi:adenylate kinase family enzyme
MRIVITGNGGSGKTWLGNMLAERLSLPLVHLDDLYWDGPYGGVGRDKQQVYDAVVRKAAEAEWIIEGIYGWLLPPALERATAFVFIDLPVADCIANLRQRGIQGHGSADAFETMLAWIADYPTRDNWYSLAAHTRLWEAFDGSKARLRNRDEIAQYLDGLGIEPQRRR